MRFLLRSILGLLGAVLLCGGLAAAASPREALWRVVQLCVLNRQVTGGAFPCLSVDISKGLETGYAVLRSPLDDVKIIVTPTVRTIGVEAERLRGAGAPNYFQDAWNSRHFITDRMAKGPGDVALAVNSKLGRSQDQLHIHVACIRSDVKMSLLRAAETVNARPWTRLQILPHAPKYWAHFLPGRDLSDVNVVDIVAAGLGISREKMDDTTIVIVGTSAASNHSSGFTILARRRLPHSSDEAHGENLLDQNCTDLKGP